MSERRTHVAWTVAEVDILAQELAVARAENPFEPILVLLGKVQEKCLPTNRRRNITTWGNCQELRRMFLMRWRELLDAEKSQPVPAAEPQLVAVEVPRPVQFQDVVAQLDLPTILAALAARMEADRKLAQDRSEAQFNALLEKFGAAKPALPERPGRPPVSFDRHGPRLPRVAIIGPLASQFSAILEQVAKFNIRVEVRIVDKDSKEAKSGSSIPVSCDYAIVTRHVSHTVHDAAKHQLPGRMFYVDQGINAVVQKLRDTASMTH